MSVPPAEGPRVGWRSSTGGTIYEKVNCRDTYWAAFIETSTGEPEPPGESREGGYADVDSGGKGQIRVKGSTTFAKLVAA